MISFFKKNKFLLTLLISGGIFIILANSSFAADEVGKSYKFFLDTSYDWKNRSETSATLKKISDYAYFYVEDEYWLGLSLEQKNTYSELINKLAEEFDETIYPSLTHIFGQEWNPGIDNDERITILLTKLKGNAGGYFNERDEISQSQDAASNAREMIYLNAVQLSNELIYSLLAHEFQHLISWNQKERLRSVKDDIWLNELRSEYAPTIAGYDSAYSGSNLERRVDDFLANPFDSLTEWRGDRYDYPSVNLFGHYLAEQFGEDAFSYLMQTVETGIKSVENALLARNYNLTFSQVFNNWAIANYLNDVNLYSGQYGYKNPYLKGVVKITPISYSIVSMSIINIAQQSKDWSPYLYRFMNKQDSGAVAKDFEIEFEGSLDRGNFNVLYVVDYLLASKPHFVGVLTLNNQSGILKIPNFRDSVESITMLISNQSKKNNFTNNDPTAPFILSVATTLFDEEVPFPDNQPQGMAKPEDYGLKEGDLIRAEGDFDIFIINQFGYKRLFLNPTIFNMYGHLTGGWKAVKTVKPAVRDAFVTSNLYRYVDSPKVYQLEVTGEDTGKLHWLNITAEQFSSQGGEAESVFIINKSELNWYPKGVDVATL